MLILATKAQDSVSVLADWAAHGQPMAGLLVTGRYPSGTDETVERIAADLAASRFLAPVSAEVMRWKYCKLLGNLGNAFEALCGRAAARLEGEPSAAARKLDELVTAEGTVYGGGSSWQSLARGTGSIEADYLNGEIILLAREHGISVPVNETLQRLANRAAAAGLPAGAMSPDQVLAEATGGSPGRPA